ncbi:MAG: eukaryotic-like serine/threonine-protein kinase [Solirubrobacterales bacterium]|nr:eukaryotic-like serine/threonine-protein kinase [Solirubrobacterales bacterium]
MIEPVELSPGTRLAGGYEIEAGLSAGAIGAVYRARAADGGAVAIKHLIDPAQANRFEIEARLLSRLSHPRVVDVVDQFGDSGSRYLVMRLVEGLDLDRVLRRDGSPGLPVDDVLEHARQTAEALHYVHEQNVIHRDVKPHNLILSPAGVVVVDFGIARERADDGGTRAIGTPLYMAPEVLVGEEISPRSDVYGLAATVWALLTGGPPSYDDPTPLAKTVPGVSGDLEDTLRAALAIRPERRLASMEAFAAGLGTPLGPGEGRSLAVTAAGSAPGGLLERIVRTTAGVFDAAAASIALVDRATSEVVYEAAWGSGAESVVGVRLERGQGLAGSVVEAGEGVAIADCRRDARFAEAIAQKTGYVPHTMLVVPLERSGDVIGALSVLDRRDGGSYGPGDLAKAQMFAELAVAAI